MPKYEIDIIDLPYNYQDLEPYISKKTMEYHYDKHHKEYLLSLQAVIDKHPKVFSSYKINNKGELNRLLSNYCKIEDDCEEKENCNVKKLQSSIRQFGGGIINHNFFFSILAKNKSFNGDSAVGKIIIKRFESYDKFIESIIKTALDIFGSGWVWLVIDNSGTLRLYKTFNQDNPWFLNMTPLLALDVWEHAYYLQYQNNREEYLENLLKVINWEQVDKNYQEYLLENFKKEAKMD